MLRSRLTAIAGHDLAVASIGPREPEASWIVFLHEGLGSLELWKDVPDRLAELTGAGVLVYSRYGNGRSESLSHARGPQYMHDEALQALPELLDACGIDDAVLVGHSDGASIAVVFAGAFPQRVRGLILEAPHVFVEELSVRSIARAKTLYETTDLREKLARYHRDVDRTFYGWNDIWLHPSFRDWNIEDYAARLQGPVLLVQGAVDEYGTRAQLDAIRARATGARVDELYLADCGHAPHRDRPEAVVPALAAFVRAHGRGAK